MKDAISVTTEATKGIGEQIADHWEITPARVCEFLGKDNPYPKLRRLLRAIAAVTKGKDQIRRLLIFKADFNAFIDELLGEAGSEEVDSCLLCDELYDAIKTKLVYMPPAERLKELREAAAVLKQEINALTKQAKH